MRALASIISCCAFVITFAQRPSPAPSRTRSVLVKGGTVHVGDGRTFDDGAVGFRNGTIDFVGYEYAVKAAYDTVIDAQGKQVYPGFILPDATLGLVEIDAVHASEDEAELGDLEPEVRALSAYNADSDILPTVRDNGVLLAQITPRGNTVSGTSGKRGTVKVARSGWRFPCHRHSRSPAAHSDHRGAPARAASTS